MTDPVSEVAECWTDPGDRTLYHAKARYEIWKIMPNLAKALDILTGIDTEPKYRYTRPTQNNER